MNRGLIVIVGAAACVVPLTALAQAPGGTARVARIDAGSVPGQPAARRVVLDTVESRITPGRPYSAEAVSETVQVLADGNRINRLSVTRVYRDGAGRIRRETLDDDGSIRTIAISDPVSHTSYTLDPATKTAYKSGGRMLAEQGTATGTYALVSPTRRPAPVGTVSGRGGTTATATRQGGFGTVTRGGGGTGSGGTVTAVTGRVTSEVLEAQNIEGVSATGNRTTTTIPAGEIGNAQDIRIVSERWFSDDLEVLVLTKHSDPRSGETTYRLRNIVRGEPDPALFMVPADYVVQERRRRREQ